MLNKSDKNAVRQVRHRRVRAKISGSPERPRLNIYRSSNNIYAQLIEDATGRTLASASTLDPEIKGKVPGGNIEAAKAVGALIARRAQEQGLKTAVFDRGGYLYHGRVAALAEAAREAGLEF